MLCSRFCLFLFKGWVAIIDASMVAFYWAVVNTWRPRQNGRYFLDDIFKCIFLNEKAWIVIKISLNFVPRVQINNVPALVQIMAWRRPGDTPLSEQMIFFYWRIYASLGLNELRAEKWLLQSTFATHSAPFAIFWDPLVFTNNFLIRLEFLETPFLPLGSYLEFDANKSLQSFDGFDGLILRGIWHFNGHNSVIELMYQCPRGIHLAAHIFHSSRDWCLFIIASRCIRHGSVADCICGSYNGSVADRCTWLVRLCSHQIYTIFVIVYFTILNIFVWYV